jgi:hypothetical protein
VEKAGGQVLYWNGHRVMGVLAMSRAIGDHCLRPYVIPEPEVRKRVCTLSLGVQTWGERFLPLKALAAVAGAYSSRCAQVVAAVRLGMCICPCLLL